MTHFRQHHDVGVSRYGLPDIFLPYSTLQKIMLLPLNFDIEGRDPNVRRILQASSVFSSLYDLEESIQPLLSTIESSGLIISERWFSDILPSKQDELNRTIEEISKYVLVEGNKVDTSRVIDFLIRNDLPAVNDNDKLQMYRNLHPLYELLLKNDRQQQFLKQWGNKLLAEGSRTESGVVIKGNWQSFSSYSGRMFCKQLPLTSLPKDLRDFILSPDERVILSLDFNNAELRILAYYSHCKRLLEQFEIGEDIHFQTGTMIAQAIGLQDADVAVIRRTGKQFAFALLYGAGISTIVSNLRKLVPTVTSATVSQLVTAFFKTYPEVHLFLDNLEKDSHLLTPFGRIKPLATFKPTQKRNYPFQSSIAVAVKQLMLIANKRFDVVHVIHDEIWILAPTREPTVVEEVIEEFYHQLLKILPDFPISGFIKVEPIGGNTHEHG